MCIDGLQKELFYKVTEAKTYKDFDMVECAEEWGKLYYGNWSSEYKKHTKLLNNLDTCVRSPIEMYTGYSAGLLNNSMRENNYTDRNLYVLEKILEGIILLSPKIPEDIVVYRLVPNKVIEQVFNKEQEGIYTYFEKGFMSTSLCKNFYQLNSREAYAKEKNLLRIRVNKDTPGIFVDLIDNRQECEIIFMPNTMLGFIAKPYKKDEMTIYECIMV